MRALAGQLFTYFGSRPVKVPPDSGLRHLHYLGDVIDFTALDVTQHKGRPLFLIKGLGRSPYVAIDLATAEGEFGVRLRTLDGVMEILQLLVPMAAPLGSFEKGVPFGYAVQPGAEIPALIITPDVLGQLYKDILGNIGCLVIIAYHLVG